MGCVISHPPEHTTSPITTPQSDSKYVDTKQTAQSTFKSDYDRVLSLPGLLEVPERFAQWFPPKHGHINISQLFKYHSELGHSATASIHEIEYKSQICAVKQIQKDNEYGRMLFETETQVLSMLKHSGIIQLKDVLFDANYYYLILQKADVDLHQMLKEKRFLSETKTRNIIYSLLKSIRYIHKKNLVHRDLKPENIMFMSTDTNNAILIDFGDAEMVENNKTYTEFVGTPSYMSPERLNEHKGWELKKADIWAIAVIAYQMYCGRLCFDGDTQKQVFGRILRSDWSWPQDRVPSDDFKDFIEQCLAADAKDRPSAVKALQHRWFAEEDADEDAQYMYNMQPDALSLLRSV